MNKKLVIVGPAASGKTHLRNRFENKGYKFDVSYTTRKIREKDGEIDGVHYHFISKDEFETKIKNNFFFEWVEHENEYYGTGKKEWDESDAVILETDGIKKLGEHRKSCFIIYLKPDYQTRLERLKERKDWDLEKIMKRIRADHTKFDSFKDYDMIITNPDF